MYSLGIDIGGTKCAVILGKGQLPETTDGFIIDKTAFPTKVERGYKEVLQGLEEGWSKEEIYELIKKNTRNYAKRQITFFKRMQNHVVLLANEATAERVIEKCLKEEI